jgi:hypothetical protein
VNQPIISRGLSEQGIRYQPSTANVQLLHSLVRLLRFRHFYVVIFRKAATDLLARTADLPRPSFDLRYSFSKSFAFGGKKGQNTQNLNLQNVHTPISGIPRFVKFKHSMTLMGYYMDHVEVKGCNV